MNRNDFEEIDPDWQARIVHRLSRVPFPKHVGLRLDEVRLDYARMTLPFRDELLQDAGIVHGGALATLIDTVVVAALLSPPGTVPKILATIDMHVHFIGALQNEDVVAEARVRRRGRSVAFVEVEARTTDGREIAHGELSYRISV